MPAYYNEIDSFCCQVLRKQIGAGNLPEGDVDERDIRDVRAADLVRYGQIHLFAGIGGFPLACQWAGMSPDFSILTGGFPCQPFSVAGKQGGATDDRYLWPAMLEIIKGARPRWVVGENVAGIIRMELDTVLSDLEAEGYTTQAFVIPACGVAAPHRRERVWIVAHDDRALSASAQHEIRTGRDTLVTRRSTMADAERLRESQSERRVSNERGWFGNSCADVENAECSGGGTLRTANSQAAPATWLGSTGAMGDAAGKRLPDWSGGEIR